MSEEKKLVPKLRFPEFRGAEPWRPIELGEASTPVTERVGERKLIPVSISAGIGFVPQAEKFGRDISGNQYQLYTLVVASRTIIWPLVKQMRMGLMPVFHCLQRRLALQG